jgi:hypothetical protein
MGVKPHLVLTESLELLDLRQHVPMAVACLIPRDVQTGESGLLSLGQQRLRFHDDYPDDIREIERRREQVPDSADLLEPFERIREALTETLKLPMARSG